MEFARRTENVNMCHIAPSSQRTHLCIPENHSLWLTTWLFFSILPTCWT
jgi:hypothetical protein